MQVVLTRRSDARAQGPGAVQTLTGNSATFADLQTRVAIANAAHGDVFVSIHSNWLTAPGPRGIGVWYNANRPLSQQNQRLATLLGTGVGRELQAAGYPVPDRGITSDTDVDAAGRATPLFVLGPERDVSRAELLGRGDDQVALRFVPGQQSMRTGRRICRARSWSCCTSATARTRRSSRTRARAAMARGITAALLEFLGR